MNIILPNEQQSVPMCMICRLFHNLLVAFVCCSPLQSFAVSEAELTAGFVEQMYSYMEQHGTKGELTTGDGATISYASFDRDCNGTAIIVVPGWSEPYLKYVEVIYDLSRKNYCIYTLDHRGQGLSSRQLSNSQIGHVDDFTKYVEDLALLDAKIVRAKSHQQIFILAHSMGGLVATLYAANTDRSLAGLVLVAPMFEVRTDFWPEWVALTIARALDWAGYGQGYVMGHADWSEKTFADNRLTHSRLRYEYGVALFRENPRLAIGGVSNRWLITSIIHGQKIDDIASQFGRKVLLFQAGIDDFVKNARQDRFCEDAGNCEKIFFKEAKHEILMERDTVRNVAFDKIFDFIEANSK